MSFNILNLFPTPLFHKTLDSSLFKDELNALEKKLNEDNIFHDNRNGNLTTTEDFILDNWNLFKIKNQIVESVKLFSDETLCYNYDNLYITQSWINVNPPGSSHHTHSHRNSVLSGVLFLNTFENCGDIKFYPHYSNMNMVPEINYKENNHFSWEHYYFTPSNGDLLIFPSYFEHSVSENLSKDKNRISLSFNTFFTPMGNKESKTLLPNLDKLNHN
jgi:uncharacterized protein (TIGR02466 family)